RADRLTRVRSPLVAVIAVYIGVSLVLATASHPLRLAATGLEHNVEGPVILLTVLLLRPSRATMRACFVAMLAAVGLIAIGAILEQAFGPAFQQFIGGPASAVKEHYSFAFGRYRSASVLVDP